MAGSGLNRQTNGNLPFSGHDITILMPGKRAARGLARFLP
jgi:ABC-type branched-subunit amino acid transport system ATPase component